MFQSVQVLRLHFLERNPRMILHLPTWINVLTALIGLLIGFGKGYPSWGLLLGFLLGPIGWIVMGFVSPKGGQSRVRFYRGGQRGGAAHGNGEQGTADGDGYSDRREDSGPICPRCHDSISGKEQVCKKCGNILIPVNYQVLG